MRVWPRIAAVTAVLAALALLALRLSIAQTVPNPEVARRAYAAVILAMGGVFTITLLALRRLLGAFDRTLEAMSDGVIILTGSTRIESLNAAALSLLGGRAADWRGRPLSEALEDAGPVCASLALGEPARDVELRVAGSGPAVLCSASLFRPGDPDGGAVLTIKDMTLRRRLERFENERERERLQRDFVANVSHEFRTPIAAIRGFAETLLSGGLDDAGRRREFVEIISHHAQRLSRLVEDVLDLSVLETPEGKADHLERVELASFCDRVARSVAPLARRARVAIETRADFHLAVEADAGRLEQVLLNLLKNAVEYNKRGGTVLLTARAENGWAHLAVSDSGMGIAQEDLDRLFHRFHRASDAKRKKPDGTGLGLMIVKRIVERHGGDVWAESEPGKGATFHVRLPAVPSAQLPELEPEPVRNTSLNEAAEPVAAETASR